MLSYSTHINENSQLWVTFVHGAGGSSSIWYKQVKFFAKQFNVLLVDLRGHGESKPENSLLDDSSYTFEDITYDIVEVLDHIKIKKSHFVGISLGTILIRQLAEDYPQYVKSMIMGGAILKLNLYSRFLIKIGDVSKKVLPYMTLYKLFAFVIMPNRNHKESRILFIREAKKMYQKEFIRWFKLTGELIPLLRLFRYRKIKIPTLYIMGEEDYIFLPSVKKNVSENTSSSISILPNCGHVVNVERPDDFNALSFKFLKNI